MEDVVDGRFAVLGSALCIANVYSTYVTTNHPEKNSKHLTLAFPFGHSSPRPVIHARKVVRGILKRSWKAALKPMFMQNFVFVGWAEHALKQRIASAAYVVQLRAWRSGSIVRVVKWWCREVLHYRPFDVR